MILIDDNKITIEEYVMIKQISDKRVIVSCKQYELVIDGIDLMVCGLNKYEIIIKGTIGGVLFHEVNA